MSINKKAFLSKGLSLILWLIFAAVGIGIISYAIYVLTGTE
ncbi:MAG: hypothetical protein ABH864_07380 [archaeon]